MLYLFSFFVETCFCEFNVEYQENESADHDFITHKKNKKKTNILKNVCFLNREL